MHKTTQTEKPSTYNYSKFICKQSFCHLHLVPSPLLYLLFGINCQSVSYLANTKNATSLG